MKVTLIRYMTNVLMSRLYCPLILTHSSMNMEAWGLSRPVGVAPEKQRVRGLLKVSEQEAPN